MNTLLMAKEIENIINTRIITVIGNNNNNMDNNNDNDIPNENMKIKLLVLSVF